MQSPSVPIDSRASSQSEDAHPTISEPGYRKHSLGDILQSPGGTDTKRFKFPEIGDGNAARQSYDIQLRMLEEQNKKRLMMARGEADEILNGSSGMTGISATGPAKNSTNVNTSVDQATYNFQLRQLEEQNKQRLMMARREEDEAFLKWK
jgi:hypothetical protein